MDAPTIIETGGEYHCPACGSDDVATDHTILLEDNGDMLEGPPEGLMCYACEYSEGTLEA